MQKSCFFQFINTVMILTTGCSTQTDSMYYMPMGAAYDDSYEYCSVSFGDTISISGSGAWVEDGVVTITKEGEYSLTGILSDGSIYINTEGNVKLILDNVSVVSHDSSAVRCESADVLYIETASDSSNSLSVSGSNEDTFPPVIYSRSGICFQGEGKLSVDSENGSGVECLSSINFNDMDMSVNVSDSGFSAESGIDISGGKLRIKAKENFFTPSVNISGGIINGIDYSNVKPQSTAMMIIDNR